MDGEYLAETRSETVEAVEERPEPGSTRSLDALTEAFTELEARLTRLETRSIHR